MVNATYFCDLLQVSHFKILPWPMDKDNCYNENAFTSVVFNLFHLQTNKKFPKEVKAQCSLFKSPNNRLFLFCYLQLFICSGSASLRLKDTILVTHMLLFT